MDSPFIEKILHIDELNLTPIQQFYKDARVLVTGGTGFLGYILIEKLLRSCPVSRIYVLMRSGKERDVKTRLSTMLDNQLFDRVKKAWPGFMEKVVAVEGDCELSQLGLGAEDKKLLIDNVNIVFHVAATVRFDEKLKKAVAINVSATRDLLLMAQQMKQLKSFVQVSTAFSNFTSSVIEEKVYPTPISYQHLFNMTEVFPDLVLEKLTPYFIEPYRNTYIYTKQIAEDLVKQETKDLPSGVFRPAIVISTYKEPVRGWINKIQGPTGISYAAGLGQLRVVCADGECVANVVPVDMCINGLIACAWDIAEKFRQAKDENVQFEMPVYNFESSSDKPITWRDFAIMTGKYNEMIPSVRSLWIYQMFLIKSYTKFLVVIFFLHTVPAAVADAILFCKGRKTRSFKFKSANIQTMLVQMSKKDREIFSCDLREVDWEDYFLTFVIGTRIYLAKDPLEVPTEAKIHWRRLNWANRILLTVLGTLGFSMIWLAMSLIYRSIFV